jgi:BMFP domain-containing protein YqiC
VPDDDGLHDPNVRRSGTGAPHPFGREIGVFATGAQQAPLVDSNRSRNHRKTIMFDSKFFEDLNARIAEVIAASPAKDIEKNMKAMLTAMFARLDLVTREEFDLQVAVLQRTREKLEALEARLAEADKNKDEPAV